MGAASLDTFYSYFLNKLTNFLNHYIFHGCDNKRNHDVLIIHITKLQL